MNLLKAILTTLPFITSLFWGLFIALSSDKKDKTKRSLSMFMFVASLLYFCHSAYFNAETAIISITDTLYSFATLSVYPMYYFYIIHITSDEKVGVKYYLIFLPSIFFAVAVGIIYVLMPLDDRMMWINEYVFGKTSINTSWIELQRIVHKLISICFGLEIIPIAWFGAKRISEFQKTINNYYSNMEGRDLRPITTLMYLFIAVSLLSATANFIGKNHFINSTLLLMIPSILFSILLFMFGYFGFFQNFTMKNYVIDNESDNDSTPTEDILFLRLNNLMKQDKLYLKPDLKISDIASLLGTNRTYISQAINREMGLSFCEWINGYRVEHAKVLLDRHRKDKTKFYVKDILFQSGFVSEASFFRIFKQATGVSPRVYVERENHC